MSSYLLLVLYCMCPGVEFCKKKKRQQFWKLISIIAVYIYIEKAKFWIAQYVKPLAMSHIMFIVPWFESICGHTFFFQN